MEEQIIHSRERELLAQISAGDEAAYKILFSAYWGQVYKVALTFLKSPDLAEDAAQDVFAHIWVKRKQLADVREFRPWLFITARNLIFNKLRSQSRGVELQEYLQDYFMDNAPGPEATLYGKDTARLIRNGIERLTPQQRKVFELSRFLGLTHEEIARETGLSRRTVKNYMVSAILSLRKYLKVHEGKLPVALWILFFLKK